MDARLAEISFFEEVKKLKKVMSDWIGEESITVEEKTIYINLLRKSDKKEFLLKCICDGEFLIQPADYVFVNPETKTDEGKEYWPDDGQEAFKMNENPRWICIAGTREYKKRHSDHQFSPTFHTLAQTVFHIFRQINGWKKNA